MSHPVELLYENLTRILESALGESEQTDAACTCCQRPAAEFGHVGYIGLDSYKTPFTHCKPCRAMSVTDISIMGIERSAGSKQVGNKFGMWGGVGWVHELESGRSTLLAPPGVYVKLPASFLAQVTVVEMTIAGHLPWIAANATFPLLYIESFGRKTALLMRGLTVSPSPQTLFCCSDAGMDSVTRVNSTIDLQGSLKLAEGLGALPTTERNGFVKLVRELSSGRITPRVATELIGKNPAFGPLFRLLPADPHQRLKQVSIAERLK